MLKKLLLTTLLICSLIGNCFAVDYTLDLVPTMTSNTAPSGVVSASSENDASLQRYPWKAFNDTGGAPGDGWQSAVAPGNDWLQYQFSSAKTIVRYTLEAPSSSQIQMPKDFTFLASNTGAFTGEEVTLNTQTAQSFTASEKKIYTFSNTTAYTYYRIKITAGGNDQNVLITEMEMMALRRRMIIYE